MQYMMLINFQMRLQRQVCEPTVSLVQLGLTLSITLTLLAWYYLRRWLHRRTNKMTYNWPVTVTDNYEISAFFGYEIYYSWSATWIFLIFTHLNLCLVTATHNFQVDTKYSYLFNLSPHIFNSGCLNTFHSYQKSFNQLIKELKKLLYLKVSRNWGYHFEQPLHYITVLSQLFFSIIFCTD